MYFKKNLGSLPTVNFIGQVKYSTPWKHFERTSSEYILFLIESGDLYIKEEGTRYHLKEGDVFILEPGKKHVGYKAALCSYKFIHFESSDIEKIEDNLEEFCKSITNKETLIFHDEKSYSEVHTYIPKYLNISDTNSYYKVNNSFKSAINFYYSSESNYPIICSTHLLEMFINICIYMVNLNKVEQSRKISKSYLTAQELKKYLDTNTYHMISNAMITEKFELNYDYLNRLLKKYFDFSIQQYIRIKKIEKAKEILLHNDIKISVVGYLVGIDNPYYFSKLFKKHVGISPSEFYKESRMK